MAPCDGRRVLSLTELDIEEEVSRDCGESFPAHAEGPFVEFRVDTSKITDHMDFTPHSEVLGKCQTPLVNACRMRMS